MFFFNTYILYIIFQKGKTSLLDFRGTFFFNTFFNSFLLIKLKLTPFNFLFQNFISSSYDIPSILNTPSHYDILTSFQSDANDFQQSNISIHVYGETNVGKSLFFNKLISKEITLSTHRPCTSNLCIVSSGNPNNSSMRVVFNPFIQSADDISLFFQQNCLDDDELESFYKDIFAHKDALPIKFPLDSRLYQNHPLFRNQSLIKEIHLKYPVFGYEEKGIEIIDTPGLNENDDLTRISSVSILDSSLLIYIFNAHSKFDDLKWILKKNPKDIIFIFNIYESYKQEEIKNVKERLKQRLKRFKYDIHDVNIIEMNVLKVESETIYDFICDKVCKVIKRRNDDFLRSIISHSNHFRRLLDLMTQSIEYNEDNKEDKSMDDLRKMALDRKLKQSYQYLSNFNIKYNEYVYQCIKEYQNVTKKLDTLISSMLSEAYKAKMKEKFENTLTKIFEFKREKDEENGDNEQKNDDKSNWWPFSFSPSNLSEEDASKYFQFYMMIRRVYIEEFISRVKIFLFRSKVKCLKKCVLNIQSLLGELKTIKGEDEEMIIYDIIEEYLSENDKEMLKFFRFFFHKTKEDDVNDDKYYSNIEDDLSFYLTYILNWKHYMVPFDQNEMSINDSFIEFFQSHFIELDLNSFMFMGKIGELEKMKDLIIDYLFKQMYKTLNTNAFFLFKKDVLMNSIRNMHNHISSRIKWKFLNIKSIELLYKSHLNISDEKKKECFSYKGKLNEIYEYIRNDIIFPKSFQMIVNYASKRFKYNLCFVCHKKINQMEYICHFCEEQWVNYKEKILSLYHNQSIDDEEENNKENYHRYDYIIEHIDKFITSHLNKYIITKNNMIKLINESCQWISSIVQSFIKEKSSLMTIKTLNVLVYRILKCFTNKIDLSYELRKKIVLDIYQIIFKNEELIKTIESRYEKLYKEKNEEFKTKISKMKYPLLNDDDVVIRKEIIDKASNEIKKLNEKRNIVDKYLLLESMGNILESSESILSIEDYLKMIGLVYMISGNDNLLIDLNMIKDLFLKFLGGEDSFKLSMMHIVSSSIEVIVNEI